MHLTPWQPFQDMEHYFGRRNRRISNELPWLTDENGKGMNQWSPSSDISETKKEFLIKAELPGVEKTDIHVSVKDGTLTIEGERSRSDESEEETLHRVESFYGKFIRAFALPANVDTSTIRAEYKKGVLRVHLPKTEEHEAETETEIQIN